MANNHWNELYKESERKIREQYDHSDPALKGSILSVLESLASNLEDKNYKYLDSILSKSGQFQGHEALSAEELKKIVGNDEGRASKVELILNDVDSKKLLKILEKAKTYKGLAKELNVKYTSLRQKIYQMKRGMEVGGRPTQLMIRLVNWAIDHGYK